MAFSSPAHGKLFSDPLMQRVRDSFHHVDRDLNGRRRLFFDNAGGSFRLKKAVETYGEISAAPDCAERIHDAAVYLQEIHNAGEQDFTMMLNADGGVGILRS